MLLPLHRVCCAIPWQDRTLSNAGGRANEDVEV